MFIQTEATPNPASLKFIPGVHVMERGTANFPDGQSAGRSPLAQRLFGIDGVSGVFLGTDFITVSKREDKDWQVMKPLILGVVMEHFTAGHPVLHQEETGGAADARGEDDPAVARIKELLDTRVRPAVAQDGGDITFRRFEGGIVYLHMQGACSGCPSSTATLRHGIENLLRHYLPEVARVEAVE